MEFILASGSPQRIELLKQIGYTPKRIIPANIEEVPKKKELPRDFSLRMAIEKVEFVRKNNPSDIILGADTVVSLGRRIIHKAYTDEDVLKFLKLFSGRRCKLYTSICLVNPKDNSRHTKIVESIIKTKKLSVEDIDRYIKTKEGIGKSGGICIDGYGAALIKWISGSYSNIVGLPLYETNNMLLANNIRPKIK